MNKTTDFSQKCSAWKDFSFEYMKTLFFLKSGVLCNSDNLEKSKILDLVFGSPLPRGVTEGGG